MLNAVTRSLLASAGAVLASTAFAADITGAGASFPAPVYAKWADAYQKATGNKVNYQSIGSSGGIKQITAKTVDFGASDMPLSPEQLEKDGMQQFPTVIGGVVPVVNIPGVQPGQLKLTGEILANIYLGKITKWNDPAIVALNTNLNLPASDIGVVRRADGSGTTFIFTNYLSKVSADWKNQVKEGATVQWPLGLGGKGNEGVSAFVQRLPGAIGYVEYAYAKQNKLTFASLKNKDGAFVLPDDENFKAAAAGADWSKNAFYEILTDKPGKDSWPITGATFILMHKVQDKPVQGGEALKFFEWAYHNGAKLATDLDYVPLPESTVKLIRASWAGIKDASGKAVFSGK
ncbi:MAG TPA: phosphate ABC transporter substrate-binding protein PstS [Rhodocyclaceae bacterium]|uniref:phosphate ABC transporter substrate-binding protein PstS n=1 Tax=Zoogloea sp. TaxID=49181 RepID=UPI002CA2C49B|nr:phosphate ABC transporter substrate-binding protein PstS [Zoogloea sp.]HMV62282.1 phosphate ABC transporter substrate-binding protein PstS [Rhodocyclaceae bacterium]HMW50759.1 phosphate ABC transporter substrate-binding protein PstS [Rhodocyclaceae bacterium]HMZ75982.1 phosphate ABC transporter substrate-binding protein PstS [Rhodocyclaceae bacterium]HNA66330.1 phosphate ABC transporter substrate-binding protein PstS [Rhodocyclaceae bacterium]HNB63433.1 phosphate ABC transporter substrate-b